MISHTSIGFSHSYQLIMFNCSPNNQSFIHKIRAEPCIAAWTDINLIPMVGQRALHPIVASSCEYRW